MGGGAVEEGYRRHEVQARGGEARDLRRLTRLDEPLREAALVEDLQGARRDPERP